ncbi:recQ-mediated genome instability protein 1-like [Coccinella septempunctata]|uniref:recQ-mediated genome instability protein 1-like n=1 Tax=Coccinella septempunctata TaxID=41139 RepID=UPI001D0696A8|nr:recQ-mediated genome instability protein 1-like [Coccinella septempunctata]
MQNELHTLKTIFDSNNIPVSIEWLEECINWCKSETLSPSYTLDQLKNSIHDQWLNLDLRDIETSVLPSGLSEKKYMVLNGNYSLQVMKVVDISKPKYWQLQQIRKENILTRPSGNEVRETIGTGKRVLQVTLTDGVQYVEAMEYKPIQLLNINLTPGIKIRLSGPVTIRRGRLMLQEQNIRILGGEVEELLIPNAAENVLASALNLPLNNNPNNIDSKLLTVEQESENITNRSIPRVSNSESIREVQSSRIPNNYSVASTVRQDDFPTDEDMEMMLLEENNLRNKKTERIDIPKNIPSISKSGEPTDEEIALLMEIEDEYVGNSRNAFNKTPDLFEDDFDADQIDHLLEVSKSKENTDIQSEDVGSKNLVPSSSNQAKKRETKSDLITEPPKKIKVPEVNNLDSSLFGDFVNEDLFADLDLDDLEKRVDTKSTVINVVELKTKIREGFVGSCRIRAKFKGIERKVTVQGEEYKAEMRIEDSTGDLIVQVHSDVISKWAGLTPVEMLNLRKSILAGMVEYKNKVQSILQLIMKKILEVDNLMEIDLNGPDSKPVMKEVFY